MSKYYQAIDDIIAPAFRWTQFQIDIAPKTLKYYYSETYGQGNPYAVFDDEPYAKQYGPITKVQIREYSRIGSIQFTYGTFTAPLHGGTSGTLKEFTL